MLIASLVCLTSVVLLGGSIYWALSLTKSNDKMIFRAGPINKFYVAIHILMLFVQTTLQVAMSIFVHKR